MKSIFTFSKGISFLAILFLFATSCQKEQNNPTPALADTTRYEVKFSTGFSQKTGEFDKMAATTPGAITSAADHIYLFVFKKNENGYALVDSMSQSAADPTFGSLNIKLPVGDYEVTILASSGASYFQDNQGIPVLLNYYTVDKFLKRFPLQVKAENAAQDVILERIVAKMEVVIEDAIPENINEIVLKVSNEYSRYDLTGSGKYSTYAPLELPRRIAAKDRAPGYRTWVYVLNTDLLESNLQTVTLTAVSGTEETIEKTIENVKFYKNRKTVISGRLFPSQGSGFMVGFDPLWGPDAPSATY